VGARLQRGPTQRTFTEEPEWCWRPTRLECLSHSVPVAGAARGVVVPEVEEDIPGVAVVLEEQAARAGQVELVAQVVKAEPGAREEPVGQAARAELAERGERAAEQPDAAAAE